MTHAVGHRLARAPRPSRAAADVADRDRDLRLGRRLLALLALGLVAIEGVGAQLRAERQVGRLVGLERAAGKLGEDRGLAGRDGTLPMAAPPSLTKSCDLNLPALPTPKTTSRDTGRPAGATMSSALPLLPVKRSAAAARCNRSPVGASALRVAGPSFKPSSQNRTRTPLEGVANGANPSLAGIGHGNSSHRSVQRSVPLKRAVMARLGRSCKRMWPRMPLALRSA